MRSFKFSVDLLATSGDITQTWTSPIYSKLYSNDTDTNPLGKPITAEEDSWIGSLINIGAMVGAFPIGYISHKFGRKVALLCIAPGHFIAYTTMAFAKNINLFYFGRFLGGLSEGAGYVVLPMYIAEIAEDSNRGMYSVTLGIFWSLGNFIPFAIGPFLSVKTFNLVLAAFPIMFVVAFSLVGTETPYHLVAEKRIDEAEQVLMRLRSAKKEEVQKELKKIEKTLQAEVHGKFTDIIHKKGLRKAAIISLALITFQQLMGCSTLSFYMQPILDASGARISSDLGSVLMGACYFSFSIITPFYIDRFGRKILTIFSSLGVAISLSVLGLYFYIKDSTDWGTDSIYWLPIVSLILEIFTFQMGLNVTPWTISSELFPNSVKQISAIAVSTTCWIMSFFVTKYFNDMVELVTTAGVFWFYAAVAVICAIFTYIFVPETKGKSLGDIQDMLKRKKSFIDDTPFTVKQID